MKKLIALSVCTVLLVAALFAGLGQDEAFAEEEREMRGVWVQTVYRRDFPNVQNDAESQKTDFISKLNQLQDAGINAIFVQVRPKGDALYRSAINPWSDILTGVQGQDPGYDPMAFMIEEAHKRGMEFHAWLNPYRVTVSGENMESTYLKGAGTNLADLADNHPAKLHPEWLIEQSGSLYYNPDLMEVKEHIRDTVVEIARDYDVDGIHFDDYFYPSNYPLPAGEGRDGTVANQRRAHVNEMVSMAYNGIKSVKADVQFGISPAGIWKNSSSDAAGSATNGGETYYSVYADCVSWIKSGTIDYIAPQVYWKIGHDRADYDTLVKWWASQVRGTQVKLYIGQGIYTTDVAKEIDTQINLNRSISEIKGSIHYSAADILSNSQGLRDKLKTLYGDIAGGSNVSGGESGQGSEDPGNLQTPEPAPSPGASVSALSTSSSVLVNGEAVQFEAYNISDYNYFKLRDIAYAINGTEKQFNTVYDADQDGINILTGTAYEVSGGELAAGNGQAKTALVGTAKLFVAGTEARSESYNIEDYNYYKLRDLGQILNFYVGWDEETDSVIIDTARGADGK